VQLGEEEVPKKTINYRGADKGPVRYLWTQEVISIDRMGTGEDARGICHLSAHSLL